MGIINAIVQNYFVLQDSFETNLILFIDRRGFIEEKKK